MSMGILLARILEWVAMPSSRDLPNPEIEPRSSSLQADAGVCLNINFSKRPFLDSTLLPPPTILSLLCYFLLWYHVIFL